MPRGRSSSARRSTGARAPTTGTRPARKRSRTVIAPPRDRTPKPPSRVRRQETGVRKPDPDGCVSSLSPVSCLLTPGLQPTSKHLVEIVAAVFALHAEAPGLVAPTVQVALHFLAHAHVFCLHLIGHVEAVANVV